MSERISKKDLEAAREPAELVSLSKWARRHRLTRARAHQFYKAGRLGVGLPIGSAIAIPADTPRPPKRKSGPKTRLALGA